MTSRSWIYWCRYLGHAALTNGPLRTGDECPGWGGWLEWRPATCAADGW